ncbi:MAG: MOSC domain-containing protein [Bryobacteraceae bacterium]
MPASLLQISVSRGGLPKRPVLFGEIGTLGVAGDKQGHPEIHGGPRQALLLITAEGIEELIAQGFALYPGAMGENLTIRGIDRRAMRPGQRYRIGEVIVELTRVRRPCEQLSPYGDGIQKAVYDAEVKAGNTASPLWGLSGFYASVIQAGTLRPGDAVRLLEEVV